QNDGHEVDAHAVSDALGATWNGIVGKLELRTTPLVWLADVQVFPRVAERRAHFKIRIGNASGQPGRGTIVVGRIEMPPGHITPDVMGGNTPATWAEQGGVAELDVTLAGRSALPWDEFTPAVTHSVVELRAEQGASDQRPVSFGLREVTANDKDLLI